MGTFLTKLASKRNMMVILLCFFVYTCSYILKLGYNANIVEIETAYHVSHSEAGLASTLFFIAYGVGQIVNGIFVRKYNLRYTLSISLILSSILNLLVLFLPAGNFYLVYIYWFLNGAVLSFLWPIIIRTAAENLEDNYKGKASIVIGTTTASGTLLVYGLSALFSAVHYYKAIFIIAAVIGVFFSVIWFLVFPKIENQNIAETGETKETEKVEETSSQKSHKLSLYILFLVVVGLLSAIASLGKDGLTIWFPLILKEEYHFDSSLSILMTMLIPIAQIFGSIISVAVNKKLKNYFLTIGVFFITAVLFLGANQLFKLSTPVLMIISMIISSLVFIAVINLTTSVIPMQRKDKKKAGFYAGLFNGCAYAGSALSSYGLGLLADNFGWSVTMIVLISVSAAACLISFIYYVYIYFFVKEYV